MTASVSDETTDRENSAPLIIAPPHDGRSIREDCRDCAEEIVAGAGAGVEGGADGETWSLTPLAKSPAFR